MCFETLVIRALSLFGHWSLVVGHSCLIAALALASISPARGQELLAPPTLKWPTFAGELPAGPPWGTACERPGVGVDCLMAGGCRELKWNAWGPIPWQALAHGEYVGPARTPHVPEYHLRVDDELEFVFVLKREERSQPYQLEVGDILRIESIIDPHLNREVTVQRDGTIDLLLIGPLRVARRTADEVRRELNERYKEFYRVTDLNVTRVKTQTRLEDLRAAVDSRFFGGGQGQRVRVAPDGTLSLPSIGAVPAHGLTLAELKMEVDARYRQVVAGLEVTPILAQRAPRHVYVVGEVRAPGRYELVAPTTVIQSIALAGGWNKGANLRGVVVFRRAEDWRMLATRLDLHEALAGKRPIPQDEIWLRDSDVVLVPKAGLLKGDDLFHLMFGRGESHLCPGGSCSPLDQTTLIAAP